MHKYLLKYYIIVALIELQKLAFSRSRMCLIIVVTMSCIAQGISSPSYRNIIMKEHSIHHIPPITASKIRHEAILANCNDLTHSTFHGDINPGNCVPKVPWTQIFDFDAFMWVNMSNICQIMP